MALYADRVKDSTSITGTGAVTLSGTAPTGFQSFATAFGASPQTVAYCIADQTGNNWEVGTGVFDGTTGLTRVTVLGSSNGGSLVNFTGGTQDVFCTAPAAYLLPAGANTQIQYNNAGAFGGSANFTYNSGTDTLTVGKLVSANFTSAAQGLVPASGGGTANFLRADGNFAAPPATAPAGSDTQIQYNNAGVLGANANFTYSSSLNTLSLGPATGTATFTTRAPTTAQNPSTFVIAAQNSIRTSGTSPGGALTLRSGNGRPTGAGNGGAVSITSGNAGTTGNGGAINITSGNGGTTSGNGGDFNLTGGSGEFGSIVSLFAGDGTSLPGYIRGVGGNFTGGGGGSQFQCGGGTLTDGGSVFFLGGTGDTGGSIELRPGFGSTTNGFVVLNNAFSDTGVKVAGASGAPTIGFYGATPIVKPTITGSRASGAALQDLLTKLASLGLITDSTTA